MKKHISHALGALTLALFLAAPAVAADSSAGPTLQLTASATESVALDEMVVTLAVERSGAVAGPLNSQVLAELNALIARAKQVKGVTARVGSLYTQQEWVKGKPSGWKVRGELVLESRDLKALGNLAGELAEKAMLANVRFQLSNEKRREVEASLLARAGDELRAKAKAASAALGFSSFEVRDMMLVDGSPSRPAPVVPLARMALAAEADGASMPVPTDGGKIDVTVSFVGKVEMSR